MSNKIITRNLEQQIILGKSKVLEGHRSWVKSVYVQDNLIISGSGDKTIRIWDINTGKCLKTLEGHYGWVKSVFAKDNLVISGSNDNTIRIWDIDSGICLKY
jgi:WD40 repeat protein